MYVCMYVCMNVYIGVRTEREDIKKTSIFFLLASSRLLPFSFFLCFVVHHCSFSLVPLCIYIRKSDALTKG